MSIYKLLLRVYPASFWNEYSEEMRAIFARRLEAAGPLGVLALSIASLGAMPSTRGSWRTSAPFLA